MFDPEHLQNPNNAADMLCAWMQNLYEENAELLCQFSACEWYGNLLGHFSELDVDVERMSMQLPLDDWHFICQKLSDQKLNLDNAGFRKWAMSGEGVFWLTKKAAEAPALRKKCLEMEEIRTYLDAFGWQAMAPFFTAQMVKGIVNGDYEGLEQFFQLSQVANQAVIGYIAGVDSFSVN